MFLGCFLKIGPKYTLFLIVNLLIFNINKIKKGGKKPRWQIYWLYTWDPSNESYFCVATPPINDFFHGLVEELSQEFLVEEIT